MKVFNKKSMKNAVVVLAAALCIQTAYAKEYPQRFWDVAKDHWAFEYIADLAERGVVNGYEDGSFKPSRTVSRAEWAKIMVDSAGLQTTDNGVYFTDMSKHWANKYVNTARNYLTGYTDGSYRPDQAATREDVTVALVRLKGYDLSDVDYSYLWQFTDVDSISNYAKGYVAVAVQNNLVSGFEDKTFRGQATLTRAEAATLLYRAFQHGNADKVVNPANQPVDPSTYDNTTTETSNEYTQQAQPQRNESNNQQTNQENSDTAQQAQTENTEPVQEEPKQTAKAYKIETLAKTNTSLSKLYYTNIAAQMGDVIYYIDTQDNQDILYSVDTTSGSNKQILKTGESVEYNDETYDITYIDEVFYDNYNDRILACCAIEADSDFGDNKKYTKLIDTSNNQVINEEQYYNYQGYIFFTDENGVWCGKVEYTDILTDCYVNGNYMSSFPHAIYSCIEKDGKLYFLTRDGVYEYDYQNVKWIVNCDYPIGGNENGFFAKSSDGNSFIHANYSAKKDYEISFDDIEIKDKKPFKSGKISRKMYVNSKNEIIFYDTENNAFRKISPNN